MVESLYDEFGNYIGPEIESDRDSDDEIEDEDLQDKQLEENGSDGEHGPGGSNGWITTINDVEMENQIVLPEDKKYYPTAEEVYGEGVETLVMDEDEQPLEQPIIKPVRDIRFEVGVKDQSTYVSTQFLIGLMSNPALVRNVALVGHLQHGKTEVYIKMEESLYDEFGNYIGPEIESDRDSDDEIEDEDLQDKQLEENGSDGEHGPGGSNGWITTINDVEMENQIVLPEDKKYYPTAEEVYGEGVETLVMDEDEQPLEQPIIKPVRDIRFEVGVKDQSTYVFIESTKDDEGVLFEALHLNDELQQVLASYKKPDETEKKASIVEQESSGSKEAGPKPTEEEEQQPVKKTGDDDDTKHSEASGSSNKTVKEDKQAVKIELGLSSDEDEK